MTTTRTREPGCMYIFLASQNPFAQQYPRTAKHPYRTALIPHRSHTALLSCEALLRAMHIPNSRMEFGMKFGMKFRTVFCSSVLFECSVKQFRMVFRRAVLVRSSGSFCWFGLLLHFSALCRLCSVILSFVVLWCFTKQLQVRLGNHVVG